jgi:hypothetical protein
VLLLVAHSVDAQTKTLDEYRVKAAFLFNFAKFVEWPAGAFNGPGDPITICAFGNPFGGLLEQTIDGKQINERKLIVRQLSDGADVPAGCTILFISADRKRQGDLLGRLKGNHVLTVGETENFAAAGGVIGFKLEGEKVRLQINICAAERARLRISSKLLSLAEIVKEEKK